MCPSIPSSVQDVARSGPPSPQNSPPAAGFFFAARSTSALVVESNDTGVCRLGTNHGFLHCVTAPPQVGRGAVSRRLRSVCHAQKTPADQSARRHRWRQRRGCCAPPPPRPPPPPRGP